MSNKKISINTDSSGRSHISTIIYWKHPRRPAHCLAQVVMSSDKVVIFLADLRTCSRYISLNDDLIAVANEVWSALSTHLTETLKPSASWYYRSGSHSSYDPYGIDQLTEIHLSLNKNKHWVEDGLGRSLTPDEESALLQQTNVDSVEKSLSILPKLPELDPDDH